MNTQEVAEKLVQFCREGKNLDAINELYADDVVSHEPKGSHMELSEGKEAAIAKNQQWFDRVDEVHSGEASRGAARPQQSSLPVGVILAVCPNTARWPVATTGSPECGMWRLIWPLLSSLTYGARL